MFLVLRSATHFKYTFLQVHSRLRVFAVTTGFFPQQRFSWAIYSMYLSFGTHNDFRVV
jgi:hypothetical protein